MTRFEFVGSCARNDLDKVRQCLALGAKVNWKKNGESGLHIAARKNYGELVEFLLR